MLLNCKQLALLDPTKTPIKEFVPEDKKFLEHALKNEAKNCCKLFLWLDCDSEGEKIAYEVLEICQQVNLSMRAPENVKRARFSAITPRDARNALQNLTQLHYPTISMVSTRQVSLSRLVRNAVLFFHRKLIFVLVLHLLVS